MIILSPVQRISYISIRILSYLNVLSVAALFCWQYELGEVRTALHRLIACVRLISVSTSDRQQIYEDFTAKRFKILKSILHRTRQ